MTQDQIGHNTHADRLRTRTLRRAAGGVAPVALGGLTLAGAALLMGGCQDSFLDPSVSGRWEATPTIMPILDRIASIEDNTGDLVEYTDPVPEDLIPQARAYRFAPGDQLTVTLYDLIEQGRPEEYDVPIDARGFIDLPQLGRLQVAGMTIEDAQAAIQEQMRRFVETPLAIVVPAAQRQQTYNIVGAVEKPGPYFIPRADYRLLEAITAGGRFDESIEEVYVIRQVALSDEVRDVQPMGTDGGVPPATPADPAARGVTPAPGTPAGQDLLNVIDDIAGPTAQPLPPPVMPQDGSSQPGSPPVAPPEVAPQAVPPGSPAAFRARTARQPETPARRPAVELVDSGTPEARPSLPDAAPPAGPTAGSWVFLNGKWVQVTAARAAPRPAPGTPPEAPSRETELITQRVVRIPLDQLLSGKQSYNIVVRPGDVIRVPATPSGLVFMTGQVQRVGPITLGDGRLTILRAIDAAGGYAAIAVPEKIELTRMIGRSQQATISLDGRAIAEQTQPDVFLKPNDRVNVGTTFWALPLAIVRNGFRVNYGFGFIIDRNLSNDLFGPPPVNQFGE